MVVRTDWQMRSVTLDDVEAYVNLENDVQEALLGVRPATLQNAKSDWQSPDLNLAESTRAVFDVTGKMIAFAMVWDNGPVPVNIYIRLEVHPEYMDTDIGAQLLTWGEARARQAIRRVPKHAQVGIELGTLRTDTARIKLFETQGFQHIRSWYTMRIDMTEAPPTPQWSDGITIKTFDRSTDEIATIKAVEEAFEDHWGYVHEPFEESLKHWRHWMDTSEDYEPSLWFLAMHGDEVAGMVLGAAKGHEDPDAGYIDILGVRRPWRKRGIAAALLQYAFGEYWRCGTKAVTLGVDAESLTGALRLYEKVGMRVQREGRSYFKVLRPGENLTTHSL